MKIPLLLLCLLFFSTHLVQAQKAPVIQGHVFDEKGQPLAFANVAVYRGSLKTTGGSTKLDGKYSIVLPDTGTYMIKVSYVGFAMIKKDIHLQADSVSLDIQLKGRGRSPIHCGGYLIIDKSDTRQHTSFNSGQLRRMPIRNLHN